MKQLRILRPFVELRHVQVIKEGCLNFHDELVQCLFLPRLSLAKTVSVKSLSHLLWFENGKLTRSLLD